jgi:hypothetical protein
MKKRTEARAALGGQTQDIIRGIFASQVFQPGIQIDGTGFPNAFSNSLQLRLDFSAVILLGYIGIFFEGRVEEAGESGFLCTVEGSPPSRRRSCPPQKSSVWVGIREQVVQGGV